jgi:hypothetical protein
MALRVASVISANTVACWPGLFHSTCRSKTRNSSAFRCGGQAGQDVPGQRELGGVGSRQLGGSGCEVARRCPWRTRSWASGAHPTRFRRRPVRTLSGFDDEIS